MSQQVNRINHRVKPVTVRVAREPRHLADIPYQPKHLANNTTSETPRIPNLAKQPYKPKHLAGVPVPEASRTPIYEFEPSVSSKNKILDASTPPPGRSFVPEDTVSDILLTSDILPESEGTVVPPNFSTPVPLTEEYTPYEVSSLTSAQHPPSTEKVSRQPGFQMEVQGGYRAKEVDAYIDNLLATNEQLAQVNGQLFSLWLAEVRELAHTGGRIPERPGSSDTISWETIDKLLTYSYTHTRKEQRVVEQPAPVVVPVSEPIAPEPEVEPEPEGDELPAEPEKPSRVKSIMGSVMFYGFLIFLVLGVYIFGASNPTGPPQSIAGFSLMTVLTRSMQDVHPQDSLIITRRVDPHTIGIGDDITFLRPNNTTVTHRVVDIRPNFQNTGLPGFQTQGTMNNMPDPDIVGAANVVGRVIFSSLFLGNVVLFIRDNIILIGILIALGIALIVVLRKLIFTTDSGAQKNEAPRVKQSRKVPKGSVRVGGEILKL